MPPLGSDQQSSQKNIRRSENKIAFFLFLGFIGWLPWLLGGNRPWAWPIMSAAAWFIFSFWLLCWFRSSRQFPHAVKTARYPLFLLALWLGYLLFQIVPIPHSLLETISPAAARAYSMADAQTVLSSISVDRGMTFVGFIKCCTYVVAFFLVLVLVESRGRLKLLIWVIVITAVLESIYGLSSAGSKTIFGFWERAHDTVSGSYPNRNHFAGLLQIAISLNIGLLLNDLLKKQSSRSSFSIKDLFIDLLSGKQGMLVVIIVFMLAALMLSASRGGILSFFAALTLVAILSFKKKKLFKGKSLLLLPSVIIIIAVVTTSVQFLLRLSTGGISGREYVWDPGLKMAADFGLFGSGLGTFQLAFPSYYSGPTQTWWHAHLDYLELFIELGAVGFFFLATAILFVIVILSRSFLKRKNNLVLGTLFGVLVGVSSILIHELSEYHFYIPANATYFFVLLGIGVVTTTIQTPKRKRK